MDNIIINQFSTTFPFNFDLNNCTYQEALSYFKIYNSALEARKKGFEAHHIIPISIQVQQLREKGINITKKEFRVSNYLNDQCARCTPFEHLLLHFIAAKDLGGEYSKLFGEMVHFSFSKISLDEISILESLNNWASEREKGNEIMRKNLKKKYAELNKKEKEDLKKELRKRFSTEEAKKKNKENLKLSRESRTEEDKKRISENIKKGLNGPEVKEKRSQKAKAYFNNMTLEEMEAFCKMRKEVSNRPELKESVSKKLKERWNSLSEKERKELKEKQRAGRSEEGKLRWKQKWMERREESIIKIKNTVKKYYESPIAHQITSETTKIAMNTPEKIAAREEKKAAYKKQKEELKDKALNWNQFQKEWKTLI